MPELKTAWLEVSLKWLAGLWGLHPTGAARFVGETVQVEVDNAGHVPGVAGCEHPPVVVGILANAIVPTHVEIRGRKLETAPRASGPS